MRVDQAGHQIAAFKVDDLIVFALERVGTDRDDAAILDAHLLVRQHFTLAGIDDVGIGEACTGGVCCRHCFSSS